MDSPRHLKGAVPPLLKTIVLLSCLLWQSQLMDFIIILFFFKAQFKMCLYYVYTMYSINTKYSLGVLYDMNDNKILQKVEK